MARIVFDTTQLVHWPGSLTGIPRVMDELARRFQDQSDNVEFVSWVSTSSVVARVDLDRFHSAGGVHYVDPVAHAARWSVLADRLAARAERANALGPASPRVAQIVRRVSRARRETVTPFEIRAGDVFLIGWGEWWDPNFVRFVVDASKRGVKIVQFVHDLGPVNQPHLAGNSSSFVEYFTAVLPQAALLVAVSEYTRRGLIEWGAEMGLSDLPVTVIREGDIFTSVEPVRPQLASSAHLLDGMRSFVLCVGTIEAKKNHALLYYVYKQAARRKIPLPPMVIVGRRGWRTDDIYGWLTEDPEVSDRFVFLHDATDAELVWLYENCRYTVFPSFFEGWGIPIAESVSRGVPCLCSSAASMPEIAPGAVRHFPPDSPENLLRLMDELRDDEALELARREAGAYVPTTWDETYQQLTRAIAQI